MKKKKPKEFHEHIKAYREGPSKDEALSGVKIAVLTSFAVEGIKEVLSVRCWHEGIEPEIFVGDYNQYSRLMLDPESALYKFSPDILFLFIDVRSLWGEDFYRPYSISSQQRQDLVSSQLEQIEVLLKSFHSNSKGLVVIHNLEIPGYSPLGWAESKQKDGFLKMIRMFNEKLEDIVRDDPGSFVFDYESFLARKGKDFSIDPQMYYMADMRIAPGLIPAMCDEYISILKPFLSKTRKCIVLDLDNTLWGGVAGEDGMSGIELGPTPQGRPFWEFQKHLLALFERGIILAVNSKNNLEDALKIIQDHPFMVLRQEHFAAMEINWDDKVSNMRKIAQNLNIGLDSLVYFDDDPFNREIMSEFLPEVFTVDLNEDPADYVRVLTSLKELNTLSITDEDRLKGRMYVQERKRKELVKSAGNVEDYLRQLEMVVSIHPMDNFSLPRIAQLTQKTNQFNLTTRRYREMELAGLMSLPNWRIYGVWAKDKFGDNGLVGVMMCRIEGQTWILDNFLLSCRVIARGVEDTMLAFVTRAAMEQGATQLLGEFIPTQKNKVAEDFFKMNGFSPDGRLLLNKEPNGAIKKSVR